MRIKSGTVRLACMATRSVLRRREAVLPVAPHIPGGAQHDRADDQDVEPVQEIPPGRIALPTLAELHADLGEGGAPTPGAGGGGGLALRPWRSGRARRAVGDRAG